MASNQEWCNQNSLRAYPIREDCQRRADNSSGVIIPNYLIVDFIITMPGTETTRVYISQLALVGDLLTFVLLDEHDVQVSVITLTPSTHTINTGYSFYGTGTYTDSKGRIVLGDLANIKDDLPEGLYTFPITETELEPRTVRPDVRGIRSLQINNRGALSELIMGHVKLLAGNNVQFAYIPADNAIRVDAIAGTGFNEVCDCTQLPYQTNIVRTINGVAIEDVDIQGDGECIEVTKSGNTILIRDKCSEPCCDCPELDYLTQSLKVLDATVTNLQSYAQTLESRISNFVSTFVLTITS